MGEDGWVKKEDVTPENFPEGSGMKALKLEVGKLDWGDKVTVGMPRQIYNTVSQIIGAMGLGDFQEVSPGVFMLVSNETSSLKGILEGLMESLKDDDKPDEA